MTSKAISLLDSVPEKKPRPEVEHYLFRLIKLDSYQYRLEKKQRFIINDNQNTTETESLKTDKGEVSINIKSEIDLDSFKRNRSPDFNTRIKHELLIDYSLPTFFERLPIVFITSYTTRMITSISLNLGLSLVAPYWVRLYLCVDPPDKFYHDAVEETSGKSSRLNYRHMSKKIQINNYFTLLKVCPIIEDKLEEFKTRTTNFDASTIAFAKLFADFCMDNFHQFFSYAILNTDPTFKNLFVYYFDYLIANFNVLLDPHKENMQEHIKDILTWSEDIANSVFY
jgi:hypothetical protein